MDQDDSRTFGGGAGTAKQDMLWAFQKSEKLVAALLESASQGIVSIDRTGRIVLANRRMEEMFGYTREELLGERIELLLPDSKRATHTHDREEYFLRPRIRPMGIGMELSGRRKDGAEFPLEVSLSYVEIDEGVFGIALGERYQPAQAPGRAVTPRSENGSGGPPGGRRGARLQ